MSLNLVKIPMNLSSQVKKYTTCIAESVPILHILLNALIYNEKLYHFWHEYAAGVSVIY